MHYEIVQLEEKTVVGVAVTSSYTDKDMGQKIAGLWTQLYEGGVHESILHKKTPYAIGLYTDYTDERYTALAGNEVSSYENPTLAMRHIPAGRYAKFSVRGHMQEAVAAAWAEIWQMDMERSFDCDFEEYYNTDWEDAEIAIFIGLR